ncbi:MAG: transcription antitermination factor NusB [Deltaproteobacteria bacterium]|nr:transcription antitermination factor NusB [Deltaproteobacteria bacterium]
MRVRTRAREIALQYLYQVDITSDHSEEKLREFIEHFVTDKDIVPYAGKLIEGVYKNLFKIDELIDKASDNWTVSRMTKTDRNILRIATFELVYMSETPYKVAINEAIDLAKRYGSPKFPAFANGVLDRISSEVL